jgi:hypothetical protein
MKQFAIDHAVGGSLPELGRVRARSRRWSWSTPQPRDVCRSVRGQSKTAHLLEPHGASHNNRAGRHTEPASTTSSSRGADDDVTCEMNAKSPRWFARNVRQVCDGAVSRSGRYRDTVRSETAIPSFSNSPWMRGAPQRRFSVANRRISDRSCGSMHGLPGRRERRRQHPRNPSRCQRATVAGRTSTSAFRHRGHHRRKHSQNRRSDARKRRSERARTPSWWRRARVSSSRSLRVDKAERSAATARKASRIACRMASRCTNVNEFCSDAILARDR